MAATETASITALHKQHYVNPNFERTLQVRDFWAGLEAATNARQATMFEAINRHMEALARTIEAVVGEALEVGFLWLDLGWVDTGLDTQHVFHYRPTYEYITAWRVPLQ